MRDRLRGLHWVAAKRGGPGGSSGPGASGPGGLSASGPSASPPPHRTEAIEALWHDLRFALRMLVQRSLFTGVAIATLALGMGINTAIFSVTNALLWRPIPAIEEPENIVEIARGTPDDLSDVAWGAFEMLRTDSTTLEDVAGWDGITLSFRDAGEGEAVVLTGREVTGNYFAVLGLQPALGRFFAPDKFWPEVAAEVVIAHHMWQERYGRSHDVLGRPILINGAPATIIGVAPEGFAGHQVLTQRDIFVPIGMPAPGMLGPPQLESVLGGYMVLLGRLAAGASIDAARQELTVLGDRFFADNGVDRPYDLRVDPYGTVPVSDRGMVATFFGLLLLTSTMVMAIACVNVANMLLSRGLERRREIAIRMSLGAGRWRVARQLLTESALLFLIAGVAGVLIMSWVTDLLVRLYLPQLTSTRLALDVSPDPRVLGFALFMSAITALTFGLAPALSATRAAATALRGGSGQAHTPRLRGVLVGGQMALSLVLLVSAGLMTRTLVALQSVDLGFDVDGVYLVKLDVEHAGYDTDRTRAFYTDLLGEVRSIPGVAAAATSRKLPLASESRLSGIFPDGGSIPTADGFRAHFNRVSTDYFRTAGLPLLEGREFAESDTADAPRVAIINATMAARLWGDESALGRRFDLGSDETAPSYEVVGIAADAHYHAFVEDPPNFMYVAATQSPDTVGHLLIRGDMESTLSAVRARVARLDADVPVVAVSTVRQAVDGFSLGQRLAAWVSGVVGVVALLLGAVGVYGVTAFAVGQRTHEIGIRMALGARSADVHRLMLRSGLRAPLVGLLIGVVLAAGATRLVASFLYGVSALDPWTYTAVVLVLGAVAAVATALPSRRAAALDPVQILRRE